MHTNIVPMYPTKTETHTVIMSSDVLRYSGAVNLFILYFLGRSSCGGNVNDVTRKLQDAIRTTVAL